MQSKMTFVMNKQQSSPSSFSAVTIDASVPETNLFAQRARDHDEDLELTRQIILAHIAKQENREAVYIDEDEMEISADISAENMEIEINDEAPKEDLEFDVNDEKEPSNDVSSMITEEMSAAISTSEDLKLVSLDEDSAVSSQSEELSVNQEMSTVDPSAEASQPTESAAQPETVAFSWKDRPRNDLMIRAALGEQVEKTPVWLFRQAGRHLPEYREYKKKVGRSFLEMLDYPEDVAECTLQPLRRYDVDAAILFSDILVISQAINIPVTMPGGVGILVPEPLKDPEDMAQRIPNISEIGPEFVSSRLGHVIDSVKLIRKKMKDENKSVPLIGFSAAPWTLLFYSVGGSSKKNAEIGMKWLDDYPEASQTLLDLLTKIVIEYCAAQVEAGCHMVQIFEAMGMMIDEEHLTKFALPCLEQISVELKSRYPEVPLMVFCRGACYMNEQLSKLGYDVVTIDGSVDRAIARDTVSGRAGLQGNYDPQELIEAEDGSKTPETVRATARTLLESLGPQRLIANLGEGLGGKESTTLVKAFVDSIHEESEKLISAQ